MDATKQARATQSLHALLLTVGLLLVGTGCGAFGGDDSGEDDSGDLSAPTGLTGQSKNSAIQLQWETVGSAETYNVYRDTSAINVKSEDPLAGDISNASYEDTSAVNGTVYVYRVTAVGSDGTESDPSKPVEKTPFSDPPDDPQN